MLEYDDVMNAQREVIYKRRRHALQGDRLKVDIANMLFETCEEIVFKNKAGNDFKNLNSNHYTFSTSARASEEFENVGRRAYQQAFSNSL